MSQIVQDGSEYYEDVIARTLRILKDLLGDGYNYFDGQPEEIDERWLPAVMVSSVRDIVRSGATQTDDLTEAIQITIALNKKDDVGADPTKDLTEYRLRKLVKAQTPNPNGGPAEYAEGTVMHALRKNLTLDDGILTSEINIEYDMARRGEAVWTQEAYITFRVNRVAIVPVRS